MLKENHFRLLPFLTENSSKMELLLIFVVAFFSPQSVSYATDISNEFVNETIVFSRTTPTDVAKQEQQQKLGLAGTYLKNVIPQWLPGLPQGIMDPKSWIKNHLGSMFASSSDEDNSPGPFSIVAGEAAALIQTPLEEDAQATWVTPEYHHKNFLPVKDAMVMGVNMRHSFFGQAVRFEARPYFAQNLISSRSYWGQDMSVTINHPLGLVHSGKIEISYINGCSDLIDRGHGIDFHSELKFTDNIGLQAGFRENETSSLGNYVMIHWKLFEN